MNLLNYMNVVEVLQVGISGICFLLGYLVYSLLKKASSQKVDEKVLKLINRFMNTTVLFVVLVFVATIVNTIVLGKKNSNLEDKNLDLANKIEEKNSSIDEIVRENSNLQKSIESLKDQSQVKEYEFSIEEAWVILYEHDHFRGTEKKIKSLQNIKNFNSINFHDKASSVKWRIPEGWKVYLYKHDSYSGEYVVLDGTGKEQSYSDLKRQFGRGDEASSLRWVKLR